MKPSALLQQAVELHERGALAEAAARYAALLRDEPQNFDALHLLGMALCQQGRFADGAEHFRRALALAPDRAETHHLLGRALKELGRTDEALASFERALALAPDHAEAHLSRADLLAEQGRHEEAIAGYDRAVALRPEFADAWCNRGISLYETGRREDAIASYDRALALRPDFAEAHSNRGNALKALGRLADAVASYDAALALRPDLAEGHSNRGAALRELDRHEEALAAYDRALALRPDYAEAHFNRGKALHDLKRHEESLASLDRALALNPGFTEAYSVRSHARMALFRLAEARADRERAVALKPGNHDYAYDLSLIQLQQGDWRAGWANHERRERKEQPAYLPLPFARWDGSPPGKERLFLLAEQAFGDMIQFARYAPYLAARGHRVSLIVIPTLVELFHSLKGIQRVIATPFKPREEKGPICWLPLMSVPHVLGLAEGDFRADVPYLAAEPARVAAWAERLGQRGFKIGIVWQGNPKFGHDKFRSIPLAHYAPLVEIPGVRLISLQKLPGSRQITDVDFRDRIETPLDEADTSATALLDTAAVMMNLDLIITSDTMAAHLAGALARPCFVALSYLPAWQWLLDRDDSPWYPSLRLFRQRAPGDWHGVFARIAEAVRELAGRG